MGCTISFPKQQILDSFKLKEFADSNFKFNENGRKFSKRVENTVGKGEMLVAPTVFSKDLYCRNIKTRPCLGNGFQPVQDGSHYLQQ